MPRNILVGLLLVFLAGILWFVFAGVAGMIFDTLYWCATSCWHQSGERVAIAIVVPLLLSLFFTRLAHFSLMSKTKKKNVAEEGDMKGIKHKR